MKNLLTYFFDFVMYCLILLCITEDNVVYTAKLALIVQGMWDVKVALIVQGMWDVERFTIFS